MGIFNFGRKDKVIDLSDRYSIPQTRPKATSKISSVPEPNANNSSPLNSFFDANLLSNQPAQSESSESPEEKRQKFIKRITEMTERLETLSTQLFHLTNRVEVLEKKFNPSPQ